MFYKMWLPNINCLIEYLSIFACHYKSNGTYDFCRQNVKIKARVNQVRTEFKINCDMKLYHNYPVDDMINILACCFLKHDNYEYEVDLSHHIRVLLTTKSEHRIIFIFFD
jgi:adenosine deaminase